MTQRQLGHRRQQQSKRFLSGAHPHRPRQRTSFTRPRLEWLEPRLVLSTTFTVKTAGDSGPGSLRNAIETANATPGHDVVEFDSSLAGTTINLSTGELQITDDLTISSLGRAAIGINANRQSRIFQIAPDVSAVIKDLLLFNGQSSGDGHAILNQGSLELVGVRLDNLSARGGRGGGIFNDGTLTLHDVTLSGDADTGGAIYNVGDLVMRDSRILNSEAETSGGSIFNAGTLDLHGVQIFRGTAPTGSAIFNDGGVVSISDVTIERTIGGAAVTQLAGALTVANSTFTELNTLAMQVIAGDAEILGSEFLASRGNLQFGADSNATISDSRIVGNSASDGAGIDNAGNLAILCTLIEGNVAGDFGGGAFNTGSLRIEDSTIRNNTAGVGGGIENRGTLLVQQSTLEGNQAIQGGGGGIRTAGIDNQMVVRDSTLSQNDARVEGAGVFIAGGTGHLILNSTISGNTGGSVAAAGVAGTGSTTIANSTIVNNLVGVVNLSPDDPTVITLVNSIVAYNRIPDISDDPVRADVVGALSSQSRHNIIGVGDPVFAPVNGASGNQVGTLENRVDPRLGPLKRNGGRTLTHALQPGSPAIDAGDPSFDSFAFDPPLLNDQRGEGFARVLEKSIDIGAIESDQVFPLPEIFIDDVELFEGNTGIALARFTVGLSETQTFPVEVRVNTLSDTALADDDFVSRDEVIVIPAGKEGVEFEVAVNGDDFVEADETFVVQLSNAAGGVIVDDTGIATIKNDDDPPVATDDAGITFVDQAITIDVLANDIGPGDLKVQIDANSDEGFAEVNADQTITFTPNAGFVGTAAFTYLVRDTFNNPSQPAKVAIFVTTPDEPVIARDDEGIAFHTDEDTPLTTSNVLDNDLSLQDVTPANVASKITAAFITPGGEEHTDPNEVMISYQNSLGAAVVSGTITAFSNADGIGGVHSTKVSDNDFSFSNRIDTIFNGEVTWSDIMISGPTDAAEVSLNVAVQGFFNMTKSNMLGTIGSVFANVSLTASAVGGGTVSASGAYEGSNIGINYTSDTVIDSVFRTNTVTIDTRFPVTVRMLFRVTTLLSSGTSEPIVGTMLADFTKGMGFPEGGDVFLLPAGFTADSVSASIVDNRLVPRGNGSGSELTVIDVDTTNTVGTVSSNGDGTFDYDPAGKFEHLRPGEFAIDSFDYQVEGPAGNSDTATVRIRVDGVNDPPIAVDDRFEVEAVDALFIAIEDLLANDGDTENTPLKLIGIDDTGLKGMLSFASDEKLVFLPETGFLGETAFEYQIEDADGGMASARVIINVTEPSQSDLGITIETPSGTQVVGEVFEYTVTVTNDGPDDARDVVVSIEPSVNSVGTFLSATPSQGTSVDPLLVQLGNLGSGETATITYQLRADEVGLVENIFRVNGSTVDPLGSNNALLAQTPAAREPRDISVALSAPPDRVVIGDLVSLTLTVTNNGPGRAENSGAALQLRGVEIEVVSVTPERGGIGDLPTSVVFGVLEQGESVNVTYLFRATTIGQATIIFLGSSDHIELTPADNVAGVVLDVVLSSGAAPVVVDDSYEVAEDNVLVVNAPGVLANDSDPDGDRIVARLLAQPRNGTVSMNADGSFKYQPAANFRGVDSFLYEAVDATGAVSTGTVTIRVLSAAEQREAITQEILSISSLNRGERRALLTKLRPVGTIRAQVKQLNAFILQIDALARTKRLTPADAQALKDMSAALRLTLVR